MMCLLTKFLFLFFLFTFTTPPPSVSCLFQNIHFPRLPPPVKNNFPVRPAKDILEICWGNKKLTISPRVLPTLVEYFRLCTNAVNVFTNSEVPLMLSFLRNKMYAIFPDVNRAFLHGAIRYEQGVAVQNALARLDKYMADKGIPLGEIKPYRWLTINTTSPKTFRSRVTNILRDVSSHPCRDLVILDGIDKTNNASLKFIPTPYQDDPLKPKFMAIPFTKQFLYDVARPDSIGVLIRYYLQSEKCLGTFSERDVVRFKQNMYNVIVHKFLPVIRADPYRLIPGYAGLLEILSDVTESINNSNQTENFNLGIKLKQTYLPSLKNKRTKAHKASKAKFGNTQDWIWEDETCSDSNEECADSDDTTKYYSYLLIILVVLCIFNCLFCLSTLGYYLFLHRRNRCQPSCPDVSRAKQDRHCTSPSRKQSKQSTVWSRTKQTLCDTSPNRKQSTVWSRTKQNLCDRSPNRKQSTVWSRTKQILCDRSPSRKQSTVWSRTKQTLCDRSPSRKQSTVWSRTKQTLCEGRKTTGFHRNFQSILCHGKRGQVVSKQSSCHGNRSHDETRRCCETTTPEFQPCKPSCGLQQIKCPHNLVSPRAAPTTSPIPYSCFPGRFGLRPGEISLFKPGAPSCLPCENSSPGYQTHQLFHCNTVTQCEEDTVQSIQGSEEFQRIVKELYEQKRSFLELTQSPRLKPEWSDSTAMSSRNEKRDKPVPGSVASPSKRGSEELARKQGSDSPMQIIQEQSNMNTSSSQSNGRPRST